MSHTPGPWATHKTEGNGGNIPDRLEIVGPEEGRRRSLIASIYGFKLPDGQANAQLIAAAPELYQVCWELEKLSPNSCAAEKARKIIAKLQREGEEKSA